MWSLHIASNKKNKPFPGLLLCLGAGQAIYQRCAGAASSCSVTHTRTQVHVHTHTQSAPRLQLCSSTPDRQIDKVAPGCCVKPKQIRCTTVFLDGDASYCTKSSFMVLKIKNLTSLAAHFAVTAMPPNPVGEEQNKQTKQSKINKRAKQNRLPHKFFFFFFE